MRGGPLVAPYAKSAPLSRMPSKSVPSSGRFDCEHFCVATTIHKRERSFLSAAVDTELKHALIQRARANDRSVSAELRLAVREHLQAESAGAALEGFVSRVGGVEGR
jgi:hypothetical protein